MAIVGPRPLLVKYLDRYNEQQKHRHDVRPGITGYAQIHGRNTVNWEKRFELDVWYTEHVSFKRDMRILSRTVKIVLGKEGISSETSETMEKIFYFK